MAEKFFCCRNHFKFSSDGKLRGYSSLISLNIAGANAACLKACFLSTLSSGAFKIGLGSPIDGEYSLLSEGVTKWNVNQTAVLKKVYVRKV